jgi:hypothetical protein
MKDPAVRSTRAREILGGRELPEGYHAMAALHLPMLGDLAILSTQEPDAEGRIEDLGERGFIYMKMLWAMPAKEQELRDFIEGRREAGPSIFVQGNVPMVGREVVTHGSLDIDGAAVLYAVHRGDIQVDRRRVEGLITTMMIDCPGDERLRVGVWLGRDPAGGAAGEPADLAGTTADEGEMRSFLRHFALCGPRPEAPG